MNDMRQTSFPGRKPLPTGETALRQKSGLAWVSILLVLCLVAGMLPVLSQGTQVGAAPTFDHDEVLVDTVEDMEGITVNLFDYWVSDKDNDGNEQSRSTNNGINRNKELRFGGTGGIDSNLDNYYYITGQSNFTDTNTYHEDRVPSGHPRKGGHITYGIVENNLNENEYPVIAKQSIGLRDGEYDHSLEYLFNPDDLEMESRYNHYRDTYENVTGLFEIDENGYYSYDSAKNYAEFNVDDNQFYVYNTYAIKNSSTADNVNSEYTSGQFFPFNSATEAGLSYQNGSLTRSQTVQANVSGLNHFFGMTMTADFLQPADGLVVAGSQSSEMTFEFSGDDDVWVFVDGVLVLDLGGVRDQANGTINFATGAVETISNTAPGSSDEEVSVSTNLYACFSAAGYNSEQLSQIFEEYQSGQYRFKDNSYHTLSFFYLERGANASNMMLKFNLDTLPSNNVVKMDEEGEPLSGITFELYDANSSYQIDPGAQSLAEVTTRNDGTIDFRDTDGKPFDFTQGNIGTEKIPGSDDAYQFYVLREVTQQAGYRTVGDIYLRYNCNAGQLLVSNKWETGAISNYSLIATNEGTMEWATTGSPNESAEEILNDGGTLFAVVLMQQSENQWVPLYGNNMDGWEIETPTGSGGQTSISNIIAAAQRYQSNGINNIFEKNTKGQWQVALDELPGDITQYYYVNTDSSGDGEAESNASEAKYIVSYYVTSSRNLNNANANNTWRVDVDSFERDFSSNIWIPNIRNMFQVQKLDQNGDPMTNGSVTYQLYESNGVTIGQDGTVTINSDAVPYDTATVQLTYANSVAVFGLDGNSNSKAPLNTDKTYYLVETSAPTGYVPSTQVVKIVVDNTGVHADAGIANDDVTVAVGAGYLLKPMEKFGANDAIDATLHDIKGVVQTGTLDGTSGTSITWNEVSDTSGSTELHLQYGIDGNLLQYRPTNGGNPYLTYDSGFGRLYIEQCTEETHNPDTHKDDIKTAIGNDAYYAVNGITPLFTGSTTVQIKNHPEIKTGDVTVTKTVTGLQNLNQDTFSFTIQFEVPSGSGVTMPNTVNYTINSSDNTATVENSKTSGTVTVGDDDSIAFTLKNGDSVTFKDLPEGLRYTITENLGKDSNLKYTYSSSITAKDTDNPNVTDTNPGDGDTAFTNTVSAEDFVTVTYTNTATLASFNFIKVDGSNNNAKLSGAGFTLYRWDGTGNAPKDSLVSGTGSGWTVIDLDAVSDENELVTATDGAVNITGLYPDATYRLVETTTPGGYIAPQGQWQLTYVGVGTQDSYNGWTIELITEDGALNKAPAFGVDGSTLYLPNYQVPEIPVTGGEGGGWMFYGLTGTLLVGGAVLTLFAFSRRRKHF